MQAGWQWDYRERKEALLTGTVSYDGKAFDMLAPKTLTRYKEIIDKHIVPELGDKLLSKLQPAEIQSYYTKALTVGRIGKKHQDKKGLSPTTVLQHHRIIHKALGQAVKWQMLVRNVADAVEPPKKERVEFSVIDTETMQKIFTYLKDKYPVAYLPVVLASTMGMRRSEILGLRWKDVDLKNGRLSVNKQLQRIDGEFVLRDTKTDSSRRSMPIPTFVIEELKAQRKHQSGLTDNYSNALNLVFTWDDGRPVDPDYVTKTFINKTAKKLGLNIRLHDLRHSYATILLGKKVPAKTVSSTLGHSSIGITMDIYSHVTPAMQEEVASIINGEFRPDCQKQKRGSS